MVELLLNTITLPAYHQQEAWVWIPFLAIATTVVVVVKTIKKFSGTSIGVLGMPESGKTQFLMNLQGKGEKYKNEGYQGTSKDEYKKFTYTTNDNKKYKIKGGTDIGGDIYNIKPYYETFLKNKDICIFLFDIQKYKDNSKYRMETNIRLDFINNHVKDASECAIIGTHVDKVKIEERLSIITIVQKFVEGKKYARLLNNNFFACNLTNEKDMNELVNKLF